MNNLSHFQRLIRRAEAAGVFDAFHKRFKKLRKGGLSPQDAGERALREALDDGCPGRSAKVIMLRHASR